MYKIHLTSYENLILEYINANEFHNKYIMVFVIYLYCYFVPSKIRRPLNLYLNKLL